MLLKKSTLVLLVLALVATSVTAQTLGDFIPIAAEPAAEPAASPAVPGAVTPPTGGEPTGGTTTPTQTSTTSTSSAATSMTSDPVVPTNPPITSDSPVVPPVVPTSSSHVVQPTQPSKGNSSKGPATGTGIVTTGSTTATVTASPTPTGSGEKTSTGASLATAGIVVGSVVVAAAIGIWVFRKWKLSPSRDFQRKIGGEDYQDYPRTYESDTVFLRNLGDQPAEPAPTKSPYNANASLPSDDQYYDAGYANDTTAQGGYGHGGHDAYGQQQGVYDHQGYDHSQGYDHGYDNTAYGAGQHDYGGSQVGGGYGGSQVGGGYGGSQVGGYGGQDAGYAHSNVGGGYQQGYDDYGHARR